MTPQKVLYTTELAGRTSGFQIAEVRPQVSGIIQKRFFEEGADVKAGDKVIVEGLQKIRPGSPVRIAEPTPVKQGAPASEKR